jgi:hypothetical protein
MAVGDAIEALVVRLVMVVGAVVVALLVVLRVGLAVVRVVFVPPKQYNPFL